jgi:hypothetical protein
MSDGIIEALLGAARRAAFAGGLTRLLRLHLRIGPESGISGSEAIDLLRERCGGPLFRDCEITYERVAAGSIALAAVEGDIASVPVEA